MKINYIQQLRFAAQSQGSEDLIALIAIVAKGQFLEYKKELKPFLSNVGEDHSEEAINKMVAKEAFEPIQNYLLNRIKSGKTIKLSTIRRYCKKAARNLLLDKRRNGEQLGLDFGERSQKYELYAGQFEYLETALVIMQFMKKNILPTKSALSA